MIAVTIPSYEDLEDENGGLYTIYNVTIEDSESGIRWIVLRRYSAFANLYSALKGSHEKLKTFRFPNKSVFNTFSQFTKERRRQGFEDLLKIAINLVPRPSLVDEFLELDLHRKRAVTIRQSRSRQNSSSGELKDDTKSDLDVPHTTSLKPPSQKDEYLDVTSEGILHAAKDEVAASARVRAELPGILFNTFITTILVYCACVTFGIIDVSTTTMGRIFLTLLSLGSTFSFLRIMLIQRETKIKTRLQYELRKDKSLSSS
eukprot:gene1295-2504_t